MKPELVDRFQIAGFVISTVIALSLIVAGQDTATSVILGLVLAVLTQLFDLQMRQTSAQETLLRAQKLSTQLVQDEWLFKHVQKIINDYFQVRDSWFELYRKRAQDAVIECRNVLHSLAEGNMTALPKSPYTLGTNAIEKYARQSLKAVAVADINYWRSPYSEKYWQANIRALQRGVKVQRIFIDQAETLRSAGDIFERQKQIGVELYLATTEQVPAELIQDLLIIDDRVYSIAELTNDGRVREESVVIDPVEVEHILSRFNQLLRYARPIEEFE
jgi:hypothetical protein